MAVYSKTIEDSDIIKLVEGKYENLLLVGCGGCMNESLAYTNAWPIFQAAEGKTVKEANIPIATHLELERIQSMLQTRGFKVRVFESYELKNNDGNEGFLCIRNSGYPFDLLGQFPDFRIDAILTVCCGAGTFGIIDDYGKDIPVRQITRSSGMISYSFIDDEISRCIDYSHSKIMGEGEGFNL